MARHRPESHLSLKRRVAFRSPKIKINVVCEGKLTEPEYLRKLARHCGALITIELVVEEAAGVPMSVVDKAIQILRQRRREKIDSLSKHDQIWAVFDKDQHPRVDEAINKAETAGIMVGYSNPCFELWLVLHYQDWNRPVHRHEIQAELGKLMPTYNPKKSKTVDFDAIKDAVQEAEARAEKLEHNRLTEGNSRGNPSTTFFKLTLKIRTHGQ
jgi:hypothetical protein